jgi:hypothetical protein
MYNGVGPALLPVCGMLHYTDGFPECTHVADEGQQKALAGLIRPVSMCGLLLVACCRIPHEE